MSNSTLNDTPSFKRPVAGNRSRIEWVVFCLVLVGALLLVGCLDAREIGRDRLSEFPPRYCFDCHGTPENANPAPPPVYWNSEAAADAHQSHLVDEPAWFKQIPCNECHLVPTNTMDPGHVDTPLPAELTWGTLATNDDATPAYDNNSGTCSGVYCHGETLLTGDGDLTQPDWYVVDGSQSACGTCHGDPPGAPHPNRADCAACHGDVIDEDGNFVNPELHVDGLVQLGDLDCDSCHGSDGVSAPPVDLNNSSDTADPGVGAHRSHLEASDWHMELTCDECHTVPTTVEDEGHLGPPPADLAWGTLATNNGAEPDYDYDATTCSGTYCHGATFETGGGGHTEPDWTDVDGGQASCGTCHGIPPAGGHVQRTDCSTCHGEVIDASYQFVSPGLHINGQVEVISLSCISCHGSIDGAAPPVDTKLNTETTEPGVGAHSSHLDASDWHAAIRCDECHDVPADLYDEGHVDTALPAELVWGSLATNDGADPDYNYTDTDCSGVYCHGSTMIDGGGINIAPDWTIVDGSQDACGACHGLPPGGSHPSQTQCSNCHGTVIDSSGDWVDSNLHINGEVNFNSGADDCDTCHGGDGESAPPVDTEGNSSPTIPGVGAHRAHIDTSTWHRDVPCQECHTVPDAVDDPGHLGDPPADVDFSGVAVADSASPAYNFTTYTCTGAYCHGTTLEPGGTLTEPIWNTTDGGSCGDCHSLPPGGSHPDRDDCGSCHSSVVDGSGNWVDRTLHINGTVNF